MARPKKGIITKKKDILIFLKLLTKWITNSKRDINILEKIFKIFDEVKKEFLFSKLVSYLYENLHIIWYINKYMNNLYDFNKFTHRSICESITFIMDNNNFNQSPKLTFIKTEKDDNKLKFKNLIQKYFLLIHNQIIKDIEINHLYNLFISNVITLKDMEDVDRIVNGEVKTEFNQEKLQELEKSEDIKGIVEEIKIKKLSTNISNLIEHLKTTKTNREECKNCKLFNKPLIPLDTNLENNGISDICFISVYPSPDDSIYGKPFTNKSGTLLREKLAQLPQETTWLFTNLILCAATQNDIGKDKDLLPLIHNCRGMIQIVFENLKSEYYIPIGKSTLELFGVKGSIVQHCGELLTLSNGSKIIPLISPHAVLEYPGKNEQLFNKAFSNIKDIINNKYQNIKNDITFKEIKQTQDKSTKKNSKYKEVKLEDIKVNLITEPNENLTLFDIIELDQNKLLNIYIDNVGKKYYLIKNSIQKVYINDKKWNDIQIVDNEMKYYVELNGYEKYKINSLFKDSLSNDKNTCLIKD